MRDSRQCKHLQNRLQLAWLAFICLVALLLDTAAVLTVAV
jgi:hypothetical protein